MEDLSLHILDILENSLEACASRIEVRIDEDLEENLLTLEIRDDGKGMDPQTLGSATDPFFTTRTTRHVGLGLSMLSGSAKATGGDLNVQSVPGQGTRVTATFHRGHIDMKPLGDIAQTLLTLIAGHPEIELCYRHSIGRETFTLDTRQIQDELKDMPINSPKALRHIHKDIREGLGKLARRTKTPG